MVDLGTADALLLALREGLVLVLLMSAPSLLASVVVGIVTGALQSATQLQEPSLSFVPKLVVCGVVVVLTAPGLGTHVVRFARALLGAIPSIR